MTEQEAATARIDAVTREWREQIDAAQAADDEREARLRKWWIYRVWSSIIDSIAV